MIISDDAGYHDFGFQGSRTMKTPHLDELAAQSVVFRQAYVSAAVCGPSRAGLFTGKYQQRFGFEENNVPGYMSASGLTGEDMGLPLTETTVADHLKGLGYATALFGKWHQGDGDRFHPTRRGFDTFYGMRTGARSYFSYSEEELAQRKNERMERGFGHFVEHQGYLTDVLAAETNAFMEQSVKDGKPFFTTLSFTAVHAPMEAKLDDLAAFPHLTEPRKTLAAMNLAMDRAVGSVMSKLDALHIAQNTLVVFMNDNGGPTDQNASNNYPLSGTKATHLEGGIRVPMLMRWPQQISMGKTYRFPVSSLDLFPTFVAAAGGDIAEMKELDGVDLMPFVQQESQLRPHQTLYWKKENRAAIRDIDWKVIRYPDRVPELYDLSTDVSESHDVAAQHPQIVNKLLKRLFAWELTLERPLWQLKREFEGSAIQRMDEFRNHTPDKSMN
ncbi:sulfatase-like hydrolase/transferase [Echinimonas agarilytica]|uniref:Sulfatase-like hydrolase/transferase n=1 Tax=Echinimonas agarilytica TaxID=1215918 RepID=A0AA42B6R2_9GAMM|nr:sulfatase-like hydrolase/transferase [Echinimonas agarilytica]